MYVLNLAFTSAFFNRHSIKYITLVLETIYCLFKNKASIALFVTKTFIYAAIF